MKHRTLKYYGLYRDDVLVMVDGFFDVPDFCNFDIPYIDEISVPSGETVAPHLPVYEIYEVEVKKKNYLSLKQKQAILNWL